MYTVCFNLILYVYCSKNLKDLTNIAFSLKLIEAKAITKWGKYKVHINGKKCPIRKHIPKIRSGKLTRRTILIAKCSIDSSIIRIGRNIGLVWVTLVFIPFTSWKDTDRTGWSNVVVSSMDYRAWLGQRAN